MEFVLRSKRVCTARGIGPADIVVEHQLIQEIAEYQSRRTAFDLGDHLIAPGFVDLHSDAVEKEIEPRPGAQFPIRTALVELDKKLAMAGITTMFHAIAFNEESLVGTRGPDIAAAIIRTIGEINDTFLSVDNLVHARYEITSFSSVPRILELIEQKYIHLLSLMDHSPGQGQFKSLAKWKQYHIPVYNLSEDEVEHIVGLQLEKRSRCLDQIRNLTDCAQAHGVLLASHDDDSCRKIDLMTQFNIQIAEFPLNIETAQYARQQGIKTGMGAPNVVRGRSQSGNISARELIASGNCSFLCSDYHPTSMLQAVYTLHREMKLELFDALQLVTTTPASIIGLADRGQLVPGLLADLVVIDDRAIPKITMTFKDGQPVYSGTSWFFTPGYDTAYA